MKKKLTAVALIVCMIAIMLVGASLAYFTDETEVKENTFTVGNVEIELTEPNWDGEGEGEGQGSKDAPEVYPGEKLAKDPTVTNVGANPCFVRIKVTGLDCLKDACGETTGDATLITVEGVNSDWTLHTDGYYYYNKVLEADKATPACFAGIRIPTALENGDAEAEFHVDVYAEAVQAQGAKASWSDVKGMTVAEIATWFGTCGMDAAE